MNSSGPLPSCCRYGRIMAMAYRKVALFLLLAGGAFPAFAGGCVYAPQKPVYNESKFIKPLPAGLMVGPPMIENTPPADIMHAVKPLPPVLLMPGRNLYLFGTVFYYYWDGDWFFSQNRSGPWYLLSKKFYPAETSLVSPGLRTPMVIKKPFTTSPYERAGH